MAETYILKLGGSLISPSAEKILDLDFLARFKTLIAQKAANGDKFGITTGGGSLARMYRDLLNKQSGVDSVSIHWIGTSACVLHASILTAFLGDLAEPEFLKFDDFDKPELFRINHAAVKVAGAGKPGHSSDVDAVIFAQNAGARRIISLKNVDGVYSADPKQNPEATRFEKLNWDEYLNVIGNPSEFIPGGNFPVDPVASRLAKESGIEFVIINGADLQNFDNLLEGKEFTGTIIS